MLDPAKPLLLPPRRACRRARCRPRCRRETHSAREYIGPLPCSRFSGPHRGDRCALDASRAAMRRARIARARRHRHRRFRAPAMSRQTAAAARSTNRASRRGCSPSEENVERAQRAAPARPISPTRSARVSGRRRVRFADRGEYWLHRRHNAAARRPARQPLAVVMIDDAAQRPDIAIDADPVCMPFLAIEAAVRLR